MKLLKNKEHVRLGSICSKIGSGATPRGGDGVYVDAGTSFIRSQNVYNGEFETAGLTYLTEQHSEQLKGVAVESRDVLLNITGDSVARCCQVPDSVLPARVNQHVSIIRPDEKELLPEFLCYYLISPLMQKYLLSRAGSGGTRKALTKGMIEDFEIPKPAVVIQRRIVEILSSFDDLIENNLRRIQLLEQAARLLYKEWFVHLRFPGHEHTRIIDGVPEGWERKLLPDVIDINPKTPVEKGKEILYVPMSALSESGMTANTADFELRNTHTAVKFKKNDVLLARITPCLENGKTGYAYFLGDDEVACGSTEFIVLRGRLVSHSFTYCLARSYSFRGNAIKSMIGSSGRQRVQTSSFDEYKVPLPPKHLLNMFDDIANTAFDQIRVLVAQNEKLAKARDLLLPKLMNGEITV